MRVAVLLLVASCELVFPLRSAEPVEDQRCETGTPFPPGTPVPLSGVHSVEGARFNPTQEVAMLSLCPTDGDPQEIKLGCDLFQSSFIASQQAFGLPVRLELSVSEAYDAYPTVTPDLSFILFGSDRQAGPKLWIAEAVNGSFSRSQAAVLENGLRFSNEPYLVDDGSILYHGGAVDEDWDLYRAEGAPPTFGPPTALPGVNTQAFEFAPVASNDELELFFASNRQVPGDELALDIFTATRSSIDEPFSEPQVVSSLTTDEADWPLWLSPNGCSLYYINKPYLDNAPQIGVLSVSHRTP